MLLISIFLFTLSSFALTEEESIAASYTLYPETRSQVEAYSQRFANYATELSKKYPSRATEINIAKEYAVKKYIFRLNQFKETRKSYLRSIVQDGVASAKTTFSYLLSEDTILLLNFTKLDTATTLVASAASTPIPTVEVPQPTATIAPTPSALSLVAAKGEESALLTWEVATGASSYNIYYAPLSGFSKATSTRLKNVTSPFVVKGLSATQNYYFRLVPVDSAGVEGSFSNEVMVTPDPIMPSSNAMSVELYLNEMSGITRTNELVHNGIPLPKSLRLFSSSNIHLEDESGNPIDSQFEVLSRFGGGVADTTRPIQWLLISFKSSVAANGTKKIYLKSGARVNNGTPLLVTQDSSKVVVDTGAAKFIVSKTAFTLFDEISIAGTKVAGGALGSATIQVDDKPVMTAQAPTSVLLEHVGPLFTTLKVSGVFDLVPYTTIKMMYVARYHFIAGSKSIFVDFSYAFPGNKSATASYESWNTSDLLQVNKVKLTLPTNNLTTASYAAAVLDSVEYLGSGSDSISVSQRLRDAMTDSSRCEVEVNGTVQAGACSFASAPYVYKTGAEYAVGASIRQMKFYEPQAMRALADRIEIEISSEKSRLGPYMGAFAGFAITASAATDIKAEGKRALHRLDHSLIVFPDRKTVARSMVLDELWDGRANADALTYYNQITTLTNNTIAGYTNRGMYGLMTYGLPVREWHHVSGYSEYGDVTKWDGYFFGGSFTDYHNANGNVVRLFAQNGDARLLHQLSFPAARRTLHTQIIQGNGVNGEKFKMGWAPVGYGGYRKDNNSSHSYFDNLYNYYYLTGDRQVIETLLVAGSNLRKAYARKSDNTLVPPELPPLNSWMGTIDRVGSQHAQIYNFLGHASSDASFLDDYKNSIERGVALYTALLLKDGREYSFTKSAPIAETDTSATTDQYWMQGLYFMNAVWNLYVDYGDLPLGLDKVTISRLFAAFNNTLWDYVAKVRGGDGTSSASWSNQLSITWSGSRHGGELLSAISTSSSEPYIYGVSKGTLPTAMFRAARLNRDSGIYDQALSMVRHVNAQNASPAANNPWCKKTSIPFIRLHGSFGYVACGIDGCE